MTALKQQSSIDKQMTHTNSHQLLTYEEREEKRPVNCWQKNDVEKEEEAERERDRDRERERRKKKRKKEQSTT